MKVKNNGVPVVHVVLASGPVALKKGDVVDMPEWVYKTLLCVFPGLTPVEEVVVNAEPAQINPVVDTPKPVEAKNAKGKKSRK